MPITKPGGICCSSDDSPGERARDRNGSCRPRVDVTVRDLGPRHGIVRSKHPAISFASLSRRATSGRQVHRLRASNSPAQFLGVTIARLDVDRALEEGDLVETVRASWLPAQRLRDGLTELERGRYSAALKPSRRRTWTDSGQAPGGLVRRSTVLPAARRHPP